MKSTCEIAPHVIESSPGQFSSIEEGVDCFKKEFFVDDRLFSEEKNEKAIAMIEEKLRERKMKN